MVSFAMSNPNEDCSVSPASPRTPSKLSSRSGPHRTRECKRRELTKVLMTLTQIKRKSKHPVSHLARHPLDDAMRYGQPITESSRIGQIGHRVPYWDFWVDMGLHMSFGGIRILNTIDQSLREPPALAVTNQPNKRVKPNSSHII